MKCLVIKTDVINMFKNYTNGVNVMINFIVFSYMLNDYLAASLTSVICHEFATRGCVLYRAWH